MKVTALEIRQRVFALNFRGYDPAEVDTFLELVASQIEQLMKDNIELRQALAWQQHDLERIRRGEDDWKKALLTVQQVNDDLIQRTQQRAQAILKEAERQAQRMLQAAEKGRQALAHDVHVLTRQKLRLRSQLRSLLEQHLALLEAQEGETEEQGADDGPIAVFDVAEVPQR